MPVPQVGTATPVASTGTYDVARFGIEDGVCGTRRRVVNPRCLQIRNLRAQIPDARVKDARRAGEPATAEGLHPIGDEMVKRA
jgi:hypothetical protein